MVVRRLPFVPLCLPALFVLSSGTFAAAGAQVPGLGDAHSGVQAISNSLKVTTTERPVVGATNIAFTIRLIRASQAKGSQAQKPLAPEDAAGVQSGAPANESASTSDAAAGPTLDDRLQDLEPQLKELDFQHFAQLDSHEIELPLRGRQTLPLMDGDQLTIRPVAYDGEKVCVWIKWRDRAGTEILDSRMRFTVGQDMILGADKGEASGMVLAIKATAKPVP